nr:succinate dehydrogenase subunit 3 [Bostrychia moritziana]
MCIINNKTISKPFSPHLSIYSSQNSSLSSIFHRFCGILLCIMLVYTLLILFFVVNLFIASPKFFSIKFVSLSYSLLFYYSFFLVFYHFLSGIRLICWNLKFKYINNKNLKTVNFVILLSYITFILIKLI